MSLVNSYLNVLEEKCGIGSTTGKSGNELFDSKPKDSRDPLENVDGLETPKPGLSVSDTDGTPKPMSKKVQKENLNPFDALLQKVLAEENWELEADKEEASGGDGMELNFSGDASTGEGELEMNDDQGDEEGQGDEDPMAQVLDALKAAVAALERVVGGEDEGEEEDSGEGEEDHEAGESAEDEMEEQPEESPFGGEISKEAVDAEELGHALVDLERLAASLNSPKSQVVKGAVPVSKGKAQTAKGPKVDGKPSEFSSNPEELENKKKQDVGGVSKGKTLLDQ